MDEIYQIVLTSALTVLGGMIIFVGGQIFLRFFIEPYQNYRKLVGEIADSLIYFGNVGSGVAIVKNIYYSQLDELERDLKLGPEAEASHKEVVKARLKKLIENSWNRADEAERTFRQQASQLMGATNMIPMYWLWALLRIAPKREEVIKASKSLIGISNSTQTDGIGKRGKEIADSLKIKGVYERFDSGNA